MSDDTSKATPETTGAKASAAAKERDRGAHPGGAAEGTRAPLPGAGTPEGDALREANAAFEAGNYALVRKLATELERAADPAVVDAARDLLRRTARDPVQLAFLGACFVALVIITYVYVLR